MIKFLTTACYAVCFAVLICMAKPATSAEIENNLNINLSADIKSDSSYQLAKATFLPDRYDDLGLSDYDSIKSIQPDRNCESYTLSSCPSGALCERCPFDVRKFRAYACTAPYLMSNGDCVCPAETPLIYPNDKCTLYCGSRCIQKTCTPSANKTGCTNSTQNCDNGCGQNTRKCCVPCTHKITSKPANSSYTYSSCKDDDGAKQIQTGWKCNPGYHERNGGCEKDCIANTCSGYTLATCPAHANCTSCSKQTTGCTGGGTVFKMTGCQSGYHQSGNSCVAHSYSCPSGYQASTCSSSQVQTGTTSKKCSCGATSGTCYACRAKTCEEQGKKTCNGSCIAKTSCCGGCPSGKKCSNGTCVASMAVGDILYVDYSTSSSVISGKTAIGVILNPSRRLAISLKEGYEAWSREYDSDNIDIPILSSPDSSYYSGRDDSERLYYYCKYYSKDCPAVTYAYNYTTPGTYQGDWHLPGIGELEDIRKYQTKLNDTLRSLGATLLSLNYYQEYWSTYAYDSYHAWSLGLSSSNWAQTDKQISRLVRPILYF